jgi:hypothetical protein
VSHGESEIEAACEGVAASEQASGEAVEGGVWPETPWRAADAVAGDSQARCRCSNFLNSNVADPDRSRGIAPQRSHCNGNLCAEVSWCASRLDVQSL